MLQQYRLDDIPPPPQKPPQDWKPGDKKPKPKPGADDDEQEKKPA